MIPSKHLPKTVTIPSLPWREWVTTHFPRAASYPFAPRHEKLWEWFDALAPGVQPRARVDVWPRGGGKSTTSELGVVRIGSKLSRRFVLYVSGTQEQANKHVRDIGGRMEELGMDRLLGKYGASKGWRRDELRAANGFSVAAYGLDTAGRGVKMDERRPDLMVFDDVDNREDTKETVAKKIRSITTSILPSGSTDCAYLFLQNLIHSEGVFAQLVDNRADFLLDREVAGVEPAAYGLTYEIEEQGPDEPNRYRVTGGLPTWEGQSLAVIQSQINTWGLEAFLRESQHEVELGTGTFFDTRQIKYCELSEVPEGLRYCRAWDLAATHGGGDYTVGWLMGARGTGSAIQCWVLDVVRGQWGADEVRAEIARCKAEDGPKVKVRLPQDPGQAGKAQAGQLKRELGAGVHTETVTGKKPKRAEGLASCMNLGNVSFVRGRWNRDVKEVLRAFRADLLHQADDDVDAGADAYNYLAASTGKLVFETI